MRMCEKTDGVQQGGSGLRGEGSPFLEEELTCEKQRMKGRVWWQKVKGTRS